MRDSTDVQDVREGPGRIERRDADGAADAAPAVQTPRMAELRARIASLDADAVEARMDQIRTEAETAEGPVLDALEAEVGLLEARRDELDDIRERRAALASAVASGAGRIIARPPGAQEARSLAGVLGSAAYEDAYARMVKTGDKKECRALLTDLVEGGQVPVPTYISERIETAWRELGLIRRLRRVSVKGVLSYPFERSASAATIHTEGAEAPAEETLTLGEVEIRPQTIKKWITISDVVLSLKGRAFLDYIYDELEQRILELAEATFLSQVRSAPAAATATSPGVPQLPVTAVSATTIFSALALLSARASRRAVAIMHPSVYYTQIMSLSDETGRPIWTSVTDGQGVSYRANGLEVLLNEALPAGTGAGAVGAEIIVGDLDGGMVDLPDGTEVRFVTDPYSLSERDRVKVVGKMFAGFGVVQDRSFVRILVQGE